MRVSNIRMPVLRCEEVECGKLLDEPAMISPEGHTFCSHVCAAKNMIRIRLRTSPHLVPDGIPDNLRPTLQPD